MLLWLASSGASKSNASAPVAEVSMTNKLASEPPVIAQVPASFAVSVNDTGVFSGTVKVAGEVMIGGLGAGAVTVMGMAVRDGELIASGCVSRIVTDWLPIVAGVVVVTIANPLKA